jgi:HEAT repeat protein
MVATILFLASNPRATTRIALDEEARGIERELRLARFRDSFSVRALWAARPLDLLRGLNDERPAIVHFAGHGLRSGGLVLPDDAGVGDVVIDGDDLRRLFEAFPRTVRLVVLNACFSDEQCDVLKEVIGCAIGMTASMGDVAARRFAEALYGALGAGRSVKVAFDKAVAFLHIVAQAGDGDTREVRRDVDAAERTLASVPVLRCRAELDPDRISFVSPEDAGSDDAAAEPDARIVQACLRALDGIDERERELAVATLARTQGDAAREALLAALRHPVKTVRMAAARQFPGWNEPRVIAGLVEAMAWDCAPELRWRFGDVVKATGTAAVPELLAALDSAQALVEGDVSMIIAHLGDLGDTRAVPALLAATRHTNAGVRGSAVRSLMRLGDASAAADLQPLLHDDDPYVRAATALCLGRLGDRSSVPALLSALRTDVKAVREAAARGLHGPQDPAAIPVLTEALGDPVVQVQLAAAEALATLGDAAGLAHLRALLPESGRTVTELDATIMRALLRFADPIAIAAIERRLLQHRSGSADLKDVCTALAACGAAGEAVLIRVLDQLHPARDGAFGGRVATALTAVQTPEAAAARAAWRLKQ